MYEYVLALLQVGYKEESLEGCDPILGNCGRFNPTNGLLQMRISVWRWRVGGFIKLA